MHETLFCGLLCAYNDVLIFIFFWGYCGGGGVNLQHWYSVYLEASTSLSKKNHLVDVYHLYVYLYKNSTSLLKVFFFLDD